MLVTHCMLALDASKLIILLFENYVCETVKNTGAKEYFNNKEPLLISLNVFKVS